MDERNKLLRSIARTERKLARLRARLEDDMRTKEEIEADIVQLETQAATARHNASDWQKTAKACEDSLSRLRAELAAIPPAPVRLRAVDADEFVDIRCEGETIYIATAHKDTCARHNINAHTLAAHICAFSQPDPNAEALAAADVLADAVQLHFGREFASLLTAYRKAREVQQ